MADEEKKAPPKAEDKQEPEKPKKKKREGGGGLSLPVMIIVGLGAIVIQVALVVAVLKFVFPQPADQSHGSDSTAVAKGHGEEKKDKPKKAEEEINYDEYEDIFSRMEKVLFVETGKIITNPKGASSVFVVTNFALEFKMMDPDKKDLAKMLYDEKSKMIKEEEIYVKKLMAATRNTINRLIASYSMEELQAKRQELTDNVRVQLRPIFREYELVILRVQLLEFIIQ